MTPSPPAKRIRPNCVAYGICKARAAGEYREPEGNVYPLCQFHKDIFASLGSKQFAKKYKIWIDAMNAKAKLR